MNKFDAVEILLVEDNPHDAELIVRALREQNPANEIFVAEDGEEALDYIFCRRKFSGRSPSKPLRAVFLDLKLPKVNGLKVLKEIKTDERTKKLPVVIVTSSREDPDIQTAYDMGANSYIVKPIQFDAFRQAMSNAGLYWLLINQPPKYS
ncbi:MAG: two-component system response regulator [Nitrospirae bacterium RBG_13_43_8]|nr:MAG: two-component system response regulator [Nitrospirae bacterium RBG_13_43_8]